MNRVLVLLSAAAFACIFQASTIVAFVIPKRGVTTYPRIGKNMKLHLFERGGGGQMDDKQSKRNKNAIPQITTIQGLDSFLEFLADSDDRIVVIEFYAAWCKSCHKFGLKYKQLAREHGDLIDNQGNIVQKGNVRFAQLEYGANVRLCKTFGIKKLPYVHMYKAPMGKIADFVCGPKYFEERLSSRLDKYLAMTDEEIKFDSDMEYGESLVLGDEMLTGLKDLNKEDSSNEETTTNV